MRINHLDVHVPDVQRTAAVFVTHFGFRQEFVRDGGGGKVIRRKFWHSPSLQLYLPSVVFLA